MSLRKAFVAFFLILYLSTILQTYSSMSINSNNNHVSLGDVTLEVPHSVIQSIPTTQPITTSLEDNEMIVTTYSYEQRFEGYQLFIVCRREIVIDRYDNFLILMDLDGNIIKQKFLGNTDNVAYLPAKFINTTTILYAGLDGAHLWNIETDQDIVLDFKSHHDYEYNPNANTIFTLKRYTITLNGIDYYFDYIEEYSLDGSKIWYLDSRNFINTSMWCPYHDIINGVRDITHSNTIFYDAEEDVLYYNPRNVNTFYKIDHKTGQVIWGLGEYGNFTLFDKYGNQKETLFYHAHSLEKIDSNTFIIFDNDYHNQTDEYSKNSRIVEITINETSMEAHESWTWEGGRSYYAYYWSDADRLPNGNRLGTFGTYEHAGDYTYGARIVEVNPQGEIVWKLDFPNTQTYSYGIYRSERVSFVPYIEPSTSEYVPIDKPVEIYWNVHAGINERISTSGSYYVYLNGTLINTGEVIFPSFRRATEIKTTINSLSEGTFNVTIVVTDNTGNKASSTRFLTTKPFLISRTGPTSIEYNDSSAVITWSGFTSSPLDYEIRLNQSLIQSGIWNGEAISYYLGDLDIGQYYVSFLLYNDTITVYNDTFLLLVAKVAPPSIISAPLNETIEWNSSLLLNWTISDTNPWLYEIYLNSELVFTENWQNYIENVSWSFPIVDEGVYNVTLVAYDQVLNSAVSTIFVNVTSPSPPAILYTGLNELIWGSSDYNRLVWEVHGGESYIIWRNNTKLAEGVIKTHNIIKTAVWFEEGWRIGNYNITIQVKDSQNRASVLTTFIKVKIAYSDPYANNYVPASSAYYAHASNALGSPDGEYAEITYDYGNGYLVLDMGENEEIIDREGVDFMVYSSSGEYKVSVSNDLTKPFIDIGITTGNQSFDLGVTSLKIARFVRIEYQSGEVVLLDAIEAFNYNEITTDVDPPKIDSPGNMTIYENTSSLIISWNVSDLTPYQYTIYKNNTVVVSEQWTEETIRYVFTPIKVGTYEITLELIDLFDNTAKDTIYVHVLPQKTSKGVFDVPGLILGIIIINFLLFSRKRRHYLTK